jgi:hypothetical protein
MVGVGSGAQDLGQYMISNVEPAVRRACERAAVRAYYDELLQRGVPAAYTFETCWREYTVGAVERWLWFLCYYVGSPLEGAFFHSQIAAFMHDHDIKVESIGQLRP